MPESISQGLQWEPAPLPLQVTGSWTTSLTSTGGLGLPPNDPGTNSGEMVLYSHHSRIGETYGGIIRKIRLRRHPGHDPRLTFSRSFIKVVEITGQPTTYEGVTLTIQPGQPHSKPIILNGMASVHGQTRSERLLPVDIKVHQDKPDPNGIPPKYNNAPKAYAASNLFVVWTEHKVTVKVKLPHPFDQQQNLPPGFIKWEVPGEHVGTANRTIPDNTLEATDLTWSHGFYWHDEVIKINIGGHIQKVHIRAVTAGNVGRVEAVALEPNAGAALYWYNEEATVSGTHTQLAHRKTQ